MPLTLPGLMAAFVFNSVSYLPLAAAQPAEVPADGVEAMVEAIEPEEAPVAAIDPEFEPVDLVAEAQGEAQGQALPPPAISAAAVAFGDVSDEDLFDRAANAIEETRTLTARFLQVSPSGSVYEGDISMRRPGQLRIDYDDPSPQLIVATNGLVYVHDSELETTDSYPVGETPLKFLLSKRLDRDAADLVDVIRGEDQVTLILAAKEGELEGELALAFSAPDLELVGWGVREPSGAVTSVELSEVEAGAKLNNRLFRAPEAGGSFLRDR